MASNGNILSMFSEADTNTKLYQWMTNRPKDPSSDTLKEVYNEQAYYYEEFMCSKLGWLGWKVGAEFLHNQLEKFGFQKEIHILDAGSGTGLVGKRMSELGYKNLTAMDISSEMLAQCKEKFCYNEFIQCDLNEDSLDEYNNTFDVIVGIGIFSKGLVKPSALNKLIKCARVGSFICISIRGVFYIDEEFGFKVVEDNLIATGKLERVSFENGAAFLQGMKLDGNYIVYKVLS